VLQLKAGVPIFNVPLTPPFLPDLQAYPIPMSGNRAREGTKAQRPSREHSQQWPVTIKVPMVLLSQDSRMFLSTLSGVEMMEPSKMLTVPK
jgi:hypothetical protein